MKNTEALLERILYAQCVVYAQQQALSRHLLGDRLDDISDQIRDAADAAFARQISMTDDEQSSGD